MIVHKNKRMGKMWIYPEPKEEEQYTIRIYPSIEAMAHYKDARIYSHDGRGLEITFSNKQMRIGIPKLQEAEP
jgi:hypothetical protein